MSRKQEISVVRRVGIMSTIILLVGLIAVFFFSQWLSEFFPSYYASFQTALMLFAIWLVITSTIRSLQHLQTQVAGWLLLLVGTVVTGFGVLLYWTFLWIYGVYKMGYTMDFSWEPVGVFTGLGFIVSIMTLINLRIENRMVGNVLEVLLIAAVVGFIIFLTT